MPWSYRVAVSKRLYASIDALQGGFDAGMVIYNEPRTYHGRYDPYAVVLDLAPVMGEPPDLAGRRIGKAHRVAAAAAPAPGPTTGMNADSAAWHAENTGRTDWQC